MERYWLNREVKPSLFFITQIIEANSYNQKEGEKGSSAYWPFPPLKFYFFLAGDHLKPQFIQPFTISFLPTKPTRMLTGIDKPIEI